MSLENFNCPQFVDFTSPDAFDINDGADFFFEKGVVGQIDLGLDKNDFKASKKIEEDENKPDTMQELVDKLKTMTNFNPKTKQPFANSANKPSDSGENSHKDEEKTTPTVPACLASYKSNKLNKENLAAQIENHSNKPNKCEPTKNTESPCNTTFSVKTPVSAKPLEEMSNVLNSKSDKQLYKQDSIEDKKLEKRHKTPNMNGSTTPLVIVESKKPSIITNSNNQQNIVKKTLAKMTAAFKHRSNDNPSLKTKTDNKKVKSNEPIRAEHQSRHKNDNEMFGQRAISPESEHCSSNRRASSVPRTLREKQALSKAGIVVLESIDDGQAKNVTKDDTAKVKASEHKSSKNKAGPPTAILSLGEKIQNFFASHKTSNQHNNNKIKQQSNNSSKVIKATILSSKTSAKKKNQSKLAEDRRRSRSCNESISNPKSNRHTRRATNEPVDPNQPATKTENGTTPKPRIPASPSSNQLKQRPRSGERGPLLPMYTGVKFVPKIHSHMKYSSMETSGYAPLIQPQGQSSHSVASLPLEDVLKQRPVCLSKRPTPTAAVTGIKIDLTKKPLLANRSVAGKSASFKYHVNSNNTSINQKPVSSSNVSLVKPSSSEHFLNSTQNINNHNTSANSTCVLDSTNANSSRIRKKSETKTSNGFLHTELRALKRHEYDQSMKEKEKIASQMKHDLDLERLKKQQEEIQKIRMQRTFRSNPIKHYKPVELKPSEKPLTEPKSPHLSGSTNKLANLSTLSKNDSFNIRSFSALVDAPIRQKPAANSNLFRSNSLLRNQDNKRHNMAASHDDIRF